MDKIILIIRVDFDCLENSNPKYETILGWVNESEVEEAILKLKENVKEFYRGYFQKEDVYPQFKTVEVNKI